MSTVHPAAAAAPGAARSRFFLLDLLRAAAVTLVIVYHVAPQAAPAGFLGVDLFFVLSGFLITRGLLRTVTDRVLAPGAAAGAEGFSTRSYFLEFYRKRVRRLFPAFAFMLLGACSLAWLASPDVRVRLGVQVLAALTSTANWAQLATGSSYFEADTPQLLKHMWSLAVEEQFYLVWPAVILAAALSLASGARSSSRLRQRLARMTLIGALLSGAAMAAVSTLTGDPNQAYLNSLTHASGLLLGAYVACLPLLSGVSALARRVLGAGALAAAVLCLAGLSESSPFTQSGGILLFSVASAVLVRLGTTGSLAALPGGFPGAGLVRWTADRSYALYLWHWPLAVLAADWIRDPDGGSLDSRVLLARAAVVVIPTLVLSEISYRLVEQPVLQRGFRGAWATAGTSRWALAGAAGLLAVTTTAAAVTAPAQTAQQTRLEELQKKSQALAEKKAEQKEPAGAAPGSAAPTPGSTAPSSGSTAPSSPGVESSEVSFIGDSVTVAVSEQIARAYPKSAVQATVGQQMWDAQDIVKQLKEQGRLGKTVVVALGANGTFTAENLQSVVSAGGEGTRFVLVTAYGPKPWIPDANAQIRAFAAKHPDTVRVAEWDSVAKGATDMAPDGVHPGDQGAELWVKEVTRAVKSF